MNLPCLGKCRFRVEKNIEQIKFILLNLWKSFGCRSIFQYFILSLISPWICKSNKLAVLTYLHLKLLCYVLTRPLTLTGHVRGPSWPQQRVMWAGAQWKWSCFKKLALPQVIIRQPGYLSELSCSPLHVIIKDNAAAVVFIGVCVKQADTWRTVRQGKWWQYRSSVLFYSPVMSVQHSL